MFAHRCHLQKDSNTKRLLPSKVNREGTSSVNWISNLESGMICCTMYLPTCDYDVSKTNSKIPW